MNLVLFGPPGAGKGTQAAFLCEELNIPQVATGDIFRKNLKEGTALGQLARSFMNEGKLVPDDVVWRLVEDRLAQADCTNGVLLDGFPRTVTQAELMLASFKESRRDNVQVVSLTVPDEELVRRLSGRRTCLNCGATYHVMWNPPKVEGVCDVCSSDVVQREDDTETAVRKRLDTYHSQTAPVLAFFQTMGLVSAVDGTGQIDAITDRIRAALA